MKKRIGAALAVLALAAALVFVARRWRSSGFSWQVFTGSLRNADWRWLALSLVLILVTYVGRAFRWEVMVRPLARKAGNKANRAMSLWRILKATCIGFTAVVLFGRAGEPVRPFLIAREEGVSFSSQIAAWVVERILDILMILMIFGIALTQVSRSAIQPSPRIEAILQAGGAAAGFAGAACLVLLLGLRLFHGRVQERLLEALTFLPDRLQSRIAGFLAAFGEGMASTRSGSSTLLLLVYSMIEWLVIAGCFFCAFRGFPATARLGLTDIVIVLGFVSFGSVLQIPGLGGGMQIVTVLVLTEFYGIGLEAASSIALVLWLISFVVIVPVGLVLAFREGIKWHSLKHIGTEL